MTKHKPHTTITHFKCNTNNFIKAQNTRHRRPVGNRIHLDITILDYMYYGFGEISLRPSLPYECHTEENWFGRCPVFAHSHGHMVLNTASAYRPRSTLKRALTDMTTSPRNERAVSHRSTVL